MKFNYILAGAVSIALALNPTPSFAQDKEAAGEARREMTIGSHVLKQKGESEYSYKNEEYYYEKVWEVAGTSKAELYKRVKSWLENFTDAEISKVSFDEEEKNTIGATLELNLKSSKRIYMDHETVNFRWVFSFKEGKVRLQGSNYRYYGNYDRGIRTRQIATGYGTRSEPYRDAREFDQPLHDLRPDTKGKMRSVYEDFDELYLKAVRSMKKMVLSDAGNNW